VRVDLLVGRNALLLNEHAQTDRERPAHALRIAYVE
jgi:hypothetical protein